MAVVYSVPVDSATAFHDLLRLERSDAGHLKLSYHPCLNNPETLDKVLATIRATVQQAVGDNMPGR